MKIILRTAFAIAFLLVAFFGLGPVVFADGAAGERIVTLVVVLAIFFLLFLGYKWMMKKDKM
jgi:hypothetical protein